MAIAGNVRIPCILGRSGIVARKREGDGGTPKGDFGFLGGYFRYDRLSRPGAPFCLRRTRQSDGWCDDPRSFTYNRPTRLPAQVRCEQMSLESGVYDIVLVTTYNMNPRTLGAGSAIFVHLRQPDGKPTEGCIAFALEDMRRLLPRLSKRVRIVIR